ncbi:MAG TPA: DUF3761 domain-containing protein [Blastocatellia bacterium]|nr:DUF3761 domain-containing protein [Blastocatellia bacterium]
MLLSQRLNLMPLSRIPILLLLLSAPVFAQQAKLEVGKPISGEIKPGINDTYRFEVEAGNTVAIQVNQKGVDVIVRAFGPNGKKLVGVDAPIGAYGAESIWFIATVSGEYKVELEPYDGRGPYEILLVFIRPTLPLDRQVINAQRQLQDSYNNLADSIERMNEGGSYDSSSRIPSRTSRGGSNSGGRSGPVRASEVPEGATAECRDGTFSFSQSRRGTCSHHGGVKRWLR